MFKSGAKCNILKSHVAVVRNIKIAVEEISNSKGYRDWTSKHKYENIVNCLQFVCKMFP